MMPNRSASHRLWLRRVGWLVLIWTASVAALGGRGPKSEW